LNEFCVSDTKLIQSDINYIIHVTAEVASLKNKLRNEMKNKTNDVKKSMEIQTQHVNQNNTRNDDPMDISKFAELHLKRKPGSGVNWTELYESYQEWYLKTHDNEILDKKKVKMYFENHIFKKTIIPVSKDIGRGWCGWTLMK